MMTSHDAKPVAIPSELTNALQALLVAGGHELATTIARDAEWFLTIHVSPEPYYFLSAIDNYLHDWRPSYLIYCDRVIETDRPLHIHEIR
jgi:hypothetical protein